MASSKDRNGPAPDPSGAGPEADSSRAGSATPIHQERAVEFALLKDLKDRQIAQLARPVEPLQMGAVGVIDALGFRGIWRRHDVASVLGALRKVRMDAEVLQCVAALTRIPARVRVASFSDTLIVTATARKSATAEKDATEAGLVLAVCTFLATVMATGASQLPRLVFRGCVSLGEVAVHEDSFVGPAVDEAAEWYERANAGVAWLLPSAATAVATELPIGLLVDWDVPLKDHGNLRTLVVNPLEPSGFANLQADFAIAPEETAKNIREAFDRRRPEVAVKLQETSRFLDIALAHSRAIPREVLPEFAVEYLKQMASLIEKVKRGEE